MHDNPTPGVGYLGGSVRPSHYPSLSTHYTYIVGDTNIHKQTGKPSKQPNPARQTDSQLFCCGLRCVLQSLTSGELNPAQVDTRSSGIEYKNRFGEGGRQCSPPKWIYLINRARATATCGWTLADLREISGRGNSQS